MAWDQTWKEKEVVVFFWGRVGGFFGGYWALILYLFIYFSEIQASSLAVQLRIIYRGVFGKLKTDLAKQIKTVLLYSFLAALLKTRPSALVSVRQFNKGSLGSPKVIIFYRVYGLWNWNGKKSLRESNSNYLEGFVWILNSFRLDVLFWVGGYWLRESFREASSLCVLVHGPLTSWYLPGSGQESGFGHLIPLRSWECVTLVANRCSSIAIPDFPSPLVWVFLQQLPHVLLPKEEQFLRHSLCVGVGSCSLQGLLDTS